MEPIVMVDLKKQYQKIKHEIDQSIQDIINQATFINGKAVTEFSNALSSYLDIPFVIPCANGTDALQVAMMALNLKPGDEIIVPSFTFIATAEAIALLKLTPIFVEIDPDTFCIKPETIEPAITQKTKAIIPVHLYGQTANMEAILKIATKHHLFVIEDCAQSLGSVYSFDDGKKIKAGTIGHIGCTSFFPSKNLGCFGDGGALFTHDQSLAERIKMIVNHGQSQRYYHDLVGCNSRLDSIQAAVLTVKLQYLDAYNIKRQEVAHSYTKAFKDCHALITPYTAPYCTHVYHQYTLKTQTVERDKLVAHLASRGVPAMIYYPVPAHKQKMFTEYNIVPAHLPITDRICKEVFSLPMHTELDSVQIDYIIQTVLDFCK
ncbi:MAG: DegT/DnrJ/EryC1/StrS family aminotransferase [Phycisphaerales bacterium]|nr:DegT/DnrJ/EryC1/StrS family aminotransferase [Phycisphaerales bacterium]